MKKTNIREVIIPGFPVLADIQANRGGWIK